MFYGAKEGCLNLDGVEFDYITFGKGTTPLVIIQGLNTRGIKGMSIPLALSYKIFAKDFKVYLFDRRKTLFDGITVEDFASDIARAMDFLKISNANILGVSQGGMIAQYLAINRPDLVKNLVLTVTLCKNNPTLVCTIKKWIRLTNKKDYKGLTKHFLKKCYTDKYYKKYRAFIPLLTLIQKPKDPERFITLAKSCLTCNTYDKLDKITAKTLIIAGKEDKIIGHQAFLQLKEKLSCNALLYGKLGHALYEEAKGFNKTVYNFFMKYF